jgi:uncharacterized membrane protein
VPTSALLFALLSGASAATWTICLKLGSTKIHAALGAMVISVVALLVNATALLAMRSQGQEIVFQREALWLLAIAGVAASGVDIFGLLAYERGLKVTASLIIGATATVLILVVGFFVMQEPVTWIRVLGIVLVAIGVVLIQAQGG